MTTVSSTLILRERVSGPAGEGDERLGGGRAQELGERSATIEGGAKEYEGREQSYAASKERNHGCDCDGNGH